MCVCKLQTQGKEQWCPRRTSNERATLQWLGCLAYLPAPVGLSELAGLSESALCPVLLFLGCVKSVEVAAQRVGGGGPGIAIACCGGWGQRLGRTHRQTERLCAHVAWLAGFAATGCLAPCIRPLPGQSLVQFCSWAHQCSVGQWRAGGARRSLPPVRFAQKLIRCRAAAGGAKVRRPACHLLAAPSWRRRRMGVAGSSERCRGLPHSFG